MNRTLGIAAVGLLGGMVVALSPSGAGWMVFLREPAPLASKAWFLLRTYATPGALAFVGMVLFQSVSRIPPSRGVVFSAGVLAWSCLLGALGVMSRTAIPGYIVGAALALEVSSRVYAVTATSRQRWPGLRIVWRGDTAGVAEIQKRAAEARTQAAESIGIR